MGQKGAGVFGIFWVYAIFGEVGSKCEMSQDALWWSWVDAVCGRLVLVGTHSLGIVTADTGMGGIKYSGGSAWNSECVLFRTLLRFGCPSFLQCAC